MSDGITLYCVSCGKYSALKKEYDEMKVKLKLSDSEWFDSSLPVYTCSCGAVFAAEFVIKEKRVLLR